ncbi:hypothetical protein P8846_11080 [Bacillus spizizenii]|uniref:hypothetical protein n=1 Tax=Bacillus atrophaeus TaxID=1452 RepID=UPI0005078286|nr:hypothetical protein [Bacillus atrophaeus]KFI02023.1 hypothetical protein JN25_16470 [Bacillus sp. BSC154]MCY8059700.1 hypothetical protein [Bacillus spizizenii]MDU7575587.1 hypothetical protein [Bacillus subtilis]MBJ7897210.1 hypothetical protein [Bacillus atrophaeus]MCY8128652.1 hypothetical protein [Bacillus spizizenii]
MTRKFGQSKYVKSYLENRYGKIYNLTFDEQTDLKKSIVMDHDKNDIERMLRRVNSSIEGAKDSQAIYNIPFTFFAVLLSIVASMAIALITVTLTSYNTLLKNYLGEEKLSKEEFLNWLKSLDYSSVFQVAVFYVFLCFIVIAIAYGLYLYRMAGKIDKRYYLNDILQECKDEYEDLKKQNKQDESSNAQ